MKALLALLLLLSVPQGAPEASGSADPELHLLWDQLLGLKELVQRLQLEQRQARDQLRVCRDQSEQRGPGPGPLGEPESSLRRRVEVLEQQSQAQAAQVASLSSRVKSSEEQQKSSATATQLPFLQVRLRASERTVELLRRKSTVLADRVCSTEKRLEELMKTSGPPQGSSSSERVEQLKASTRANAAAPGATCWLTSGRHPEASSTRVSIHPGPLKEPPEALHSRLVDLEQKVKGSERRELLVHDQLSIIGSRLNSSQTHLDELRRDAADQGGRLRSAEGRVDELQVENRGQWDQIFSLEARLRGNQTEALELRVKVGEERLEQLTTQHTAAQLRLGSAEQHLEQLESRADGLQVQLSRGGATLEQLKAGHTGVLTRLDAAQAAHTALDRRLAAADAVVMKVQAESSELKVKLGDVQKQLEHLQTERPGTLKVAFSAGLTDSGSVGPFDAETTLIFSKTFSNVGGAYDPGTGVFTAPVRGLYFFSFTAADFLKGYTGLRLYRNSRPLLFSLGLNDHGGYASMSSGLVLQLDQADAVRLQLPASYRLYDDGRNFSCFSGFLLFPLSA